MTDRQDESEYTLMSDELAQRLLARVVELDAEGRSATSISRLRDVTRELGIPDATFDRALLELRAMETPAVHERDTAVSVKTPRSWWRRFLKPASGRSLVEEVLVNAGMFAAFMSALGLASRFSRFVDGDWQLKAGLFVLINIIAVALARRYRARPVMYVLAVTAVAQTVEYVMHLIFGIRAVQGGDTHWAVLISAAVAILSAPLLRSRDDAEPLVSAEEEVPRPEPPPASHRPHWWSFLRVTEAT